ncbi:MAG: hypothetical protein JSU66_08510 [Deltaproteobacteria bacterium]|nr:MAG: hypothetical protein JSU66_08510 [Deltaproteobacteria bacterium]
MQIRAKRFFAGWAALGLACLVVGVAAQPADAQSRQKSKQARGMFVSFDAAAKTVTVKEKGKQVVYNVTPEGSVLTRTTVKINGVASTVTDLQAGFPVIVYWRPDEKDKTQRYARMIDAPDVPEDLREDFENQ